MLYVFHVDEGYMMTFDMTVALSSVENLKATIERLHGIPAANIVLLVSGGEMLLHSTQVSYYSAGTDTNPIYMFLNGDVRLPHTPQPEQEVDLREQVERSMALPAVYDTVVKRAQLALKMYENARDEERLCERLVHDQHLQQQGWSAVVANMEDLTDEFRQRVNSFFSAFDQHLEKRSKYLELLQNFGDDLTKLAHIPILPGLMPLAEADFHGFDEFLDTDDVFSRSHNQQESVLVGGGAENNECAKDGAGSVGDDKSTSTSPSKKLKMGNDATDEAAAATTTTSQTSTTSSTRSRKLNLLQWITSKENHDTLDIMSNECIQGLGTFDADKNDKLKVEAQNIIKLAQQADVKEIKGLGERLYRLEEFKFKINGMVRDQKELSTAFQQNQSRAMHLRDASILPDLCESHQSQLVAMQQNYQKIRDHRRCITKAKDELGANLHARLKRIVWIENAMSEFDNRLLFYHRCLRRAERHINIIEQIHQAPCIYVAAVTEVVRRKIFSTEFRQWATKLAEDFDAIHSEEIKRRQLFNANFEGHFLNILFPGMSDMPPAFANDIPLVFDTRLPNLTRSDIDMLSGYLPDLAPQIQLPDMGPVINFFVSRSGTHQKERLEKLLKQQVAAAFNAAGEKTPQLQRLIELQKDAGCDVSETDTETEFEKLPAATTQTVATSTCAQELAETMERSTGTERLMMQSAETLTEENESASRAEVEHLRTLLSALFKLSMECIRLTQVNLKHIRADAESYRDDLQLEVRTLHGKLRSISEQCAAQEQQQPDNESNLQLLRDMLHKQDNELELLQQQTAQTEALQNKCDNLESQVLELTAKVDAAQQDKDKAVAEAREELIHEHKTEIESLRCRFKLMTSMEHSPSETSLEKIERPPSCGEHHGIDLAQHEAIIAQLRAELEEQKEKAIQAAVEVERSMWQSKLDPRSPETSLVNVGILTNVLTDKLNDILADKDRELSQMREKDQMLTAENYQLKTRLDALTNEDGNSWQREKIEFLMRDNRRLEQELCSLRSGLSGSSHKNVVLESCNKGDIVFLVFNAYHGQFMVVQDSPILYFVHGDSLGPLNLRLPPEQGSVPFPYWALARITVKEYCQARKDVNRYRVKKGFKFYRIKLEPINSRQAAGFERLESFSSSSISRSVSQIESHSEPKTSLGGSVAFPIASSTTPRQSHSMSSAGGVFGVASKDVVDLAASTSPTIVTTAARVGEQLDFKERTISITSVTEEDDEPVTLLSERCRYISVSEEDEPVAAAAASQPALLQPQQQPVITEQPTGTSILNLDLMLASADVPQPQHETITTQQPTVDEAPTLKASTMSDIPSTLAASTSASLICSQAQPIAAIRVVTDDAEICASSVATMIGTASEDSDEYRSLDGTKDEADFPISE